MTMDDLAGRVRQIRELLGSEMYTLAAKESASLIEFALRELLRRHTSDLESKDRIRVNQAEIEIGKGEKGIEEMTMGQLAGVLRTSRFFEAWSGATGRDLSSISMINLKAVISLRNQLVHEGKEVGRGEAEMLFNVLRTFLETFGILTLDDAGAPASTRPAGGRRVDRSGAGAMRTLAIVGATAITVTVAGFLLVPGLRVQLAEWLNPSGQIESVDQDESQEGPGAAHADGDRAQPAGFTNKQEMIILVDVASLQPEQLDALKKSVETLQARQAQEASVFSPN
jgi:hypothetical protein